jgi:predicted enzyme related to lactoylglutathione lyase
MHEPLLRKVDAVTFTVPDLDAGLEVYERRLGHTLLWRNDAIGQAGLACADSDTEIVLSTVLDPEANWLVESADSAAAAFVEAGGRVLADPADIPVGRVAVVEDPFGNRLVLIDLTAGRYRTGPSGEVTGIDEAGA